MMDYAYFGIRHCKNSNCNNLIRIKEIIQYKIKGLSRSYNGYCSNCRFLNQIENLKW